MHTRIIPIAIAIAIHVLCCLLLTSPRMRAYVTFHSEFRFVCLCSATYNRANASASKLWKKGAETNHIYRRSQHLLLLFFMRKVSFSMQPILPIANIIVANGEKDRIPIRQPIQFRQQYKHIIVLDSDKYIMCHIEFQPQI